MFADRIEAGRRLGAALRTHGLTAPVVVGLPRGGVPVAAEVADALHAPLDVIVVRKLGAPFQRELAMGAVGENGARVLNEQVVRAGHVSPAQLAAVEERERGEVQRRAARFRGDSPPLELAGRTVVIVDDGIATGSTARAACRVARERGASRIVLAVPVGPPGTDALFGDVADEVVCLQSPVDFYAVGQAYRDFAQVSDDAVEQLLRQAARRHETAGGDVLVDAGGVQLPGRLAMPHDATEVVVFAHGSGSSRRSPRNRHVAEALEDAGFGTLLFDLLTGAEEADRHNVFDISLLAARLAAATAWLRTQAAPGAASVGYFGASTGAAAALVAATAGGTDVAAVVSRGGRPDLAGPALDAVRAPTLLVVGGADEEVLELNRAAQRRLRCENRLTVVSGATHLFEEPGALDEVARLAVEWFRAHP